MLKLGIGVIIYSVVSCFFGGFILWASRRHDVAYFLINESDPNFVFYNSLLIILGTVFCAMPIFFDNKKKHLNLGIKYSERYLSEKLLSLLCFWFLYCFVVSMMFDIPVNIPNHWFMFLVLLFVFGFSFTFRISSTGVNKLKCQRYNMNTSIVNGIKSVSENDIELKITSHDNGLYIFEKKKFSPQDIEMIKKWASKEEQYNV